MTILGLFSLEPRLSSYNYTLHINEFCDFHLIILTKRYLHWNNAIRKLTKFSFHAARFDKSEFSVLYKRYNIIQATAGYSHNHKYELCISLDTIERLCKHKGNAYEEDHDQVQRSQSFVLGTLSKTVNWKRCSTCLLCTFYLIAYICSWSSTYGFLQVCITSVMLWN